MQGQRSSNQTTSWLLRGPLQFQVWSFFGSGKP
jgi:hypothetical protein